MFKEIESELMSILSEEYVEKVAHMPTKDVEKVMDLIYQLDLKDITRMYSEDNSNYRRIVVIYNGDEEAENCDYDCSVINGKLCHITFVPSHLLDKSEKNALTLMKFIVKYLSIRTSLLIRNRNTIVYTNSDHTIDLLDFQAIPVIACAVLRKIYSGVSLATHIYNTIAKCIPTYAELYCERGVESILDLFDAGMTVEELLDNSLICAISPDDKNYPNIWDIEVKDDMKVVIKDDNEEE